MHVLYFSLASVTLLALQAAGQIADYNSIYSGYDYCQGITPTTQTYQPIAGATLKKVQLFMRHGDRVPGAIFPGDDANYNMCGNSLENHYSGDNVLSRTPAVQTKTMNPDDSPFAPLLWKGNCDTHNVGKNIRAIYVDMLKFLSKVLNPDVLYVRNTYATRTRESVEHMLNGLYPSFFRTPGTVIEMNAYPQTVENVLINSESCPAIPDTFRPFTTTSAFLNFYKTNYPLMTKINSILGLSNTPRLNSSLNGDMLIPRLCNNMPLPCSQTNPSECITPAEAVKAIAGAWVMSFGPMRYGPQAEKVKRITGGLFVGTIPKNIRATLKDDPSTRPFEFYSVHDQSIDQIMAIISDPNTPWPGYAATLVFETWQLPDRSLVVRAIYEGKVVQAHPDLKCSLDACPLDTFAAFLESFVPADPKAECSFYEEHQTKIESSGSTGRSNNNNYNNHSSSSIGKFKNTNRNMESRHSSNHHHHQERSRMTTDSDTESLPDSDRFRLHRKASRESLTSASRGSEPGSELDEDNDSGSMDRNKRHSYPSSIAPSTATPVVKRAKRNPSIKCPICHEYVTPGQYQQHYKMELAQLEAGASNEVGRGKRGAAIAASKQFIKGKTRASASDQEKQNMLRDIQKRRNTRQNNKDGNGVGSGRGGRDLDLGLASALGDALSDDAPATCFICNERLFGSLDDINTHIDACLTNPQPARHDSYSSSGANTPTSGGASGRSSTATTPNARMTDSFDEYTWAGQTRIRATALFEGGMSALGSGSRTVQEDIDDDLNVEDDEDDEYGGAQFTERDVVLNTEDPDADELREIVMESTTDVQRAPPSPTLAAKEARRRHRGVDRDVDIEDMGDDPGDVDDDPVDEDEEIDLEGDDDDAIVKGQLEDHRVDALMSSALASGDTRLLIEALRSKVKHLESANKNVPTCLICLEPYRVPLTSIVCWHVHCEACWMQTLGSKKLCPQCQKITLPKDLRRIYL
ncbi:hypothetical protein BGX33_010255 [Mortierella sp. NVP41]|nr:hypothetical protein BGX33_010255 [Mortierella sp. NVP41]